MARQLIADIFSCAGICKRQLGNLVEDLKSEVQRLNEGKQTAPFVYLFPVAHICHADPQSLG